MAYLVAGPFIALVGIVAVFFVMRRKSVEQRSMYSARRQQIEHKVRAARQRTLAPHGHAEKPPPEAAPATGASPFDQTQAQPTIQYEYQPTARQAPSVAPPPPASPSQWETPAAPPQQMPWEQAPAASTQAPAQAPDAFEFPSAPPEPVEPFRPAPEPTPLPKPSEPAWTPAPMPSEPATQIEQPVSAATTSSGGWSIVSTEKAATIAPEHSGKKKKGKAAESAVPGSWSLASGEAPGAEAEEPEVKRPSGTVVAMAQYAVLVVGLVMVLIGVLVMVANSHVT